MLKRKKKSKILRGFQLTTGCEIFHDCLVILNFLFGSSHSYWITSKLMQSRGCRVVQEHLYIYCTRTFNVTLLAQLNSPCWFHLWSAIKIFVLLTKGRGSLTLTDPFSCKSVRYCIVLRETCRASRRCSIFF